MPDQMEPKSRPVEVLGAHAEEEEEEEAEEHPEDPENMWWFWNQIETCREINSDGENFNKIVYIVLDG